MRMDSLDASPGPSAMDQFRLLLAQNQPAAQAAMALLDALEATDSLEMALDALRRCRPANHTEAGWVGFRKQLETRAHASLERRRAQWHMDPRRCRWRILVSVFPPATMLGPSALQARLGEKLLAAGLPLALTLSDRPRPSLGLGPVLPLGMESLGEWVDLDLREVPVFPPERLSERFGTQEGLTVRRAEAIPIQASPLLELAHSARWVWPCPQENLAQAKTRLEEFQQAHSWEIEKSGKAGGRKVLKQIEVRGQVLDLVWQGTELHFETRVQEGAGMNPQKLLGGILGWPTEAFAALRRIAVVLSEDPRLADRDRYETRLHNMFEDAVLLESAPEFPDLTGKDEDEIIRL